MLDQEPLSLRACAADTPVVMIGLPLDHNSSHLKGPRHAPGAIRAALQSGSMNWTSETGLDLESEPNWGDAGDLELRGDVSDMKLIERVAEAHWQRGARLVSLGGDHSVTAPILRGARRHTGPLTIVHFDAHPDLYPDFQGNPHSHASPFYRILEEGLASRLIQIGIRTMNAEQQRIAERHGVEIKSPDEISGWTGTAPNETVYISLDMDALDPAFAPGVSHHEPGGLTVREILGALKRVRGPVVGADIVELNPDRDASGLSAMVAAKLLKELLALVLQAGSRFQAESR